MTTKILEAKDDLKSSESLEAPHGAQIVTSMLSYDLVESEVYKRCISLMRDFGHKKASHLATL